MVPQIPSISWQVTIVIAFLLLLAPLAHSRSDIPVCILGWLSCELMQNANQRWGKLSSSLAHFELQCNVDGSI